jgi:prokaryotic YEATS domain
MSLEATAPSVGARLPSGFPLLPRVLLGAFGLVVVIAGCVAAFREVAAAAATVLITLGVALIACALLLPYVKSFKGAGLELQLWDRLTGDFSKVEQVDSSVKPSDLASALLSDDAHPADSTYPDLDDPLTQLANFSPDDLDEILLAVHFSQRGLFLGHAVKPMASTPRTTWEFAVFVTGWGSLDEIDKAEFYMGSGWGRQIFNATPDGRGQVGIVVKAFNEFLVLARVTLKDGTQVLLNHYCNLPPGERLEDNRFRVV